MFLLQTFTDPGNSQHLVAVVLSVYKLCVIDSQFPWGAQSAARNGKYWMKSNGSPCVGLKGDHQDVFAGLL